ncbi:hypothetical protein [Neolewinella litorea]|uniref:Uncharacterized protein n=1 Tax=Neolewinella litorea TaxID=2562452 RepID=A0A4S4NID5_9BACT|nr:hypothetical protein [Neolewinella litorea]THH37978.1 hypothetical protein E4021_13175 [Neolewinella litorea]
MNHDYPTIRPPWSSLFGSAWALGIVLIFAFGIPRFSFVLSANVTGQYGLVSLVFVAMWCTPWVFLTRAGRDSMGMKWPDRPAWLLSADAILDRIVPKAHRVELKGKSLRKRSEHLSS